MMYFIYSLQICGVVFCFKTKDNRITCPVHKYRVNFVPNNVYIVPVPKQTVVLHIIELNGFMRMFYIMLFVSVLMATLNVAIWSVYYFLVVLHKIEYSHAQ